MTNDELKEKFGFSVWKEGTPNDNGPWWLQTPEHGHVYFGSDKDSADQCLSAIKRLCETLSTGRGT